MCVFRGLGCGGHFSPNGAGSRTAVGSEAQNCGLVWGSRGPRAVAETKADLRENGNSVKLQRPPATASLRTATWDIPSVAAEGHPVPTATGGDGPAARPCRTTRALSESERDHGARGPGQLRGQEDAATRAGAGEAAGGGARRATQAGPPPVGRSEKTLKSNKTGKK